jgi:hypothetical protein
VVTNEWLPDVEGWLTMGVILALIVIALIAIVSLGGRQGNFP